MNGDTEPRCVCADDDFDGRPDWTGEFCETPLDGCPPLLTDANNPCRNGGECSDRDECVVCVCADTGFDGVTCEEDVDECLSNPCLNGGTCSNTEGGFDCGCVAGFIGDVCETDARGGCPDSQSGGDNPCENGGVCDDSGGAVTCDCTDTGFTGTSCAEPSDDCDPNPCQQGASCVDLINDYSCNCPQGFAGKDCDEAAPCDDDLEDCAPDQFCETGSQTCEPDTCDPNENRRCEGNTVVQCEPNGSGRTPLFTCVGRPGAFASACQDGGDEDAYCPCEDDWDCPADTVCEVDRCVGTGQPATCSLPAAPFEDVLPTNEITWGGIEQAAGSVDFALDGAVGSPFPNSSQVVVTPLVANLDDDNGDGLVDERDFQEVQKTIDYWPFQIIEFFPAERRMRVETHAIGNALVSLDSELIDVFERTLGDPAPETPTITALGTGPLQLPLTIESSAFVQPAGHELHSTWFQVAPTAAFAEVEIDVHRAFENLYGTTAPPDYDPVDLHAGIDLLRSEIPANALINGQHFVRVRHRDKNLEWSAWSDAVPFTVEGSVGGYPEIALDAATYDVGAPIRITYEHGPGNADDWIGLYRDGDVSGQIPSRTWSYVNGTSGAVTLSLDEPGPYYAAFFESGGYGELAARVPFYVGPVPDLDVDPHFVLSGADVRVEFTTAPALADDWIGAYRAGEVPSTVGSSSWQYVQAAAGVMALNGLSDGLYFAGYFLRDGYTEAGPRTYFVVGPSPVTVATDAATYAATGTIEVTFGGGPGTEGDWIGVFPAGSEPSEVSVAAMIPIPGAADGRVDLPAVGFTAGDHQVALFVDGSYHEVSNRASFTVLP